MRRLTKEQVLMLHARLIEEFGGISGVRDENSLKPAAGGKVENRAPGGKTVRTVLLVAAVVLIVAGAFNGSARDVFGKAVKICTECVGLG